MCTQSCVEYMLLVLLLLRPYTHIMHTTIDWACSRRDQLCSVRWTGLLSCWLADFVVLRCAAGEPCRMMYICSSAASTCFPPNNTYPDFNDVHCVESGPLLLVLAVACIHPGSAWSSSSLC